MTEHNPNDTDFADLLHLFGERPTQQAETDEQPELLALARSLFPKRVDNTDDAA